MPIQQIKDDVSLYFINLIAFAFTSLDLQHMGNQIEIFLKLTVLALSGVYTILRIKEIRDKKGTKQESEKEQ
jgi:hypothetical protein